jgi:hypothetical protein
MDPNLLKQARDVALLTCWRPQLTIPSVLAEGETFSLRITAFGPDGLPSADFPDPIRFDESSGIEGLPASASFDASSGGMIEIPGLKAIGPELARVKGTVGDAGHSVSSNPAWVFPDPPYRVFWGDIHIHTKYSNCSPWSCLDPEFGYQFAREAAHLDFAAAADHLRGIAAEEGRWERLQQLTRDYEHEGRFIPFLAFESSHKTGFGGDNNIYYRQADGPYFWLDREDMKGTQPEVRLEDLWKWLDGNGHEYFSVPHHTGRAGKFRAFDNDTYDPSREPLFEVYSAWGSSEKRLNQYPLHGGNTDNRSYLVDTLKEGCRYGVICSSDDHTTLPGGASRNWSGGPFALSSASGFHHMGLAAVRATELTRDALWEALVSRNTYGTTMARTLLDVKVGDLAMGQEGTVSGGDPLFPSRTVEVTFTAAEVTGAVTVTLVRNGVEIDSRRIGSGKAMGSVQRISFQDGESLESIAMRDARHHPEPFVVYYVRLQSLNLQTQWSSPIWLDLA